MRGKGDTLVGAFWKAANTAVASLHAASACMIKTAASHRYIPHTGSSNKSEFATVFLEHEIGLYYFAREYSSITYI